MIFNNDMERVLQNIGNIPITTTTLQNILPKHLSFNAYISRLEKTGELVRLKKGLYVVSKQISHQDYNTYLIANRLYGPSYISFYTALQYHGLIDDLVQTIQSTTIKRSTNFINPIGYFTFTSVDIAYFSIGIQQILSNGTSYLIATKEKALCDLLTCTSNLNFRYQKELREYLTYDLRFDMDRLKTFDTNILSACVETGKKTHIIKTLIKIIQKT